MIGTNALKKDNPLPAGEGGGFILPGLKTYIVSVLTALFAAALAWLDSHHGGVAIPFIKQYQDAIIAALAAAAIAAIRAALSKIHDTILHIHGLK